MTPSWTLPNRKTCGHTSRLLEIWRDEDGSTKGQRNGTPPILPRPLRNMYSRLQQLSTATNWSYMIGNRPLHVFHQWNQCGSAFLVHLVTQQRRYFPKYSVSKHGPQVVVVDLLAVGTTSVLPTLVMSQNKALQLDGLLLVVLRPTPKGTRPYFPLNITERKLTLRPRKCCSAPPLKTIQFLQWEIDCSEVLIALISLLLSLRPRQPRTVPFKADLRSCLNIQDLRFNNIAREWRCKWSADNDKAVRCLRAAMGGPETK